MVQKSTTVHSSGPRNIAKTVSATNENDLVKECVSTEMHGHDGLTVTSAPNTNVKNNAEVSKANQMYQAQHAGHQATANIVPAPLYPRGSVNVKRKPAEDADSEFKAGVAVGMTPISDSKNIGDRHSDDGRLDVLDLLPKMYRPVTLQIKPEPISLWTTEAPLEETPLIQLSSDDEEDEVVFVRESKHKNRERVGLEARRPTAEPGMNSRPKTIITLDVTLPKWPVPLPFESLPPETRASTHRAMAGNGEDTRDKVQKLNKTAVTPTEEEPERKKSKKTTTVTALQ